MNTCLIVEEETEMRRWQVIFIGPKDQDQPTEDVVRSKHAAPATNTGRRESFIVSNIAWYPISARCRFPKPRHTLKQDGLGNKGSISMTKSHEAKLCCDW